MALNRTKIEPLDERQRLVLLEYLRFVEAIEPREETSFLQSLLSGVNGE